MYKISVIIPYYNSEKTILRALNSVISQTYKDFEIILINDGSIDSSNKIVDDFINKHKEYKITNIYQKNSGPSKARNEGIKKAKGQYISLLDADDSWHEKKLDIQMEFLGKNGDIAILGCDYNVVIENSINRKSENTGEYEEVNFYKRLFRNYFSTPTVIIKKEVLNELEGFNENQKYAEDSLLFIQILRKYKGGKIKSSLVNLYKNEYGVSGLSSNLKELEKWELNNFKVLYSENYKCQKKINLFLYLCIITFSYVKYLRRMIICKIRKKDC